MNRVLAIDYCQNITDAHMAVVVPELATARQAGSNLDYLKAPLCADDQIRITRSKRSIDFESSFKQIGGDTQLPHRPDGDWRKIAIARRLITQIIAFFAAPLMDSWIANRCREAGPTLAALFDCSWLIGNGQSFVDSPFAAVSTTVGTGECFLPSLILHPTDGTAIRKDIGHVHENTAHPGGVQGL